MQFSTAFQILDINIEIEIHPESCAEDSIVALVHSAPKNIELRNTVRQTWGQNQKTIFVLGQSSIDPEIQNEASKFNDILQFDFIDAYRNMTYKHLSGYYYMLNHCAKTKYILKSDDDQAIDTFHLPHYLSNFIEYDKFYLCLIMTGIEQKPQRDPKSKWYVSYEDYEHESYPDFCSGWAYVTSLKTMNRILDVSKNHSYFWIDDMFVTGMLAQKVRDEILVYDWRNNFLTDHIQSQESFLYGKFFTPEIMVASDLEINEMVHMFKKFKNCDSKKCFEMIYNDPKNKDIMKPPSRHFAKLQTRTEL